MYKDVYILHVDIVFSLLIDFPYLSVNIFLSEVVCPVSTVLFLGHSLRLQLQSCGVEVLLERLTCCY